MPPRILALHGFLGSGHDFRPALGGWPWPWQAPDLPGHGGRPPWEEPGLEGLARELAARHGDADVLVGYSYGGRLALAMADVAPHRWRALVLIGASPGLADASERRARRAWDEAAAERLEREGLEPFLGWWASLPVLAGHRRIPRELQEARRSRALTCDPRALATTLRLQGTGRMAPLHDRLGRLAMPALWVAGEEDRKFLAIGRECASRMPAGELLVVPRAGHAPHLERPAWTGARIASWLSEQVGCGGAEAQRR